MGEKKTQPLYIKSIKNNKNELLQKLYIEKIN